MTELNSSERMKKTCKKVAMFLGLALGSVFIPVAHFVLVPTFLVLSLVFGWLEFAKKYQFQFNDVPCLHCKKKFEVKGTSSETSVRVFCNHCGSQNSVDILQLDGAR